MAIEWTEDLSVGVDSIDKQHQIWFQKANDLFEAGMQGKARNVIPQLFDFLDDYTKTHFRDEEQYMLEINYPELASQQRYHKAFIDKLQKIKDEYGKSGGNVAVIINANQMVIDWLTNHIAMEDKKIGEYVRKQKAAGKLK